MINGLKFPKQESQPSLEDRVKEERTQPSKEGPRFTDLYVNIRGTHYLFNYLRSSDGTPDMYEDKITGLLMPKGKFNEIDQEYSKSLLGEKVYDKVCAHIQNRQPNASEENREPNASKDFNFYLKIELLNENPELALVVTDEEGDHNKILQRELYRHLRRYREDGLVVLSVPKEAGQVVQNGNSLSLYPLSSVNGFDWRNSSRYKWRTGLPVTPKA